MTHRESLGQLWLFFLFFVLLALGATVDRSFAASHRAALDCQELRSGVPFQHCTAAGAESEG